MSGGNKQHVGLRALIRSEADEVSPLLHHRPALLQGVLPAIGALGRVAGLVGERLLGQLARIVGQDPAQSRNVERKPWVVAARRSWSWSWSMKWSPRPRSNMVIAMPERLVCADDAEDVRFPAELSDLVEDFTGARRERREILP